MSDEKKDGACAACCEHGVFHVLIYHQHLREYVGLCRQCAPLRANEVVRAMNERYGGKLVSDN